MGRVARQETMWLWDPRPQGGRYRDLATGRFLERERVLGWINESIQGSQVATRQLAQLMLDGALSPGDFERLMRQELKNIYIEQYLRGIGGREQMTKADWGSIGGMLKEQYSHLAGFAADLPGLTLEQAQARADMYANSAREAFERANGRVAKNGGMTEELWVLGEAEHCGDCLMYAAEGWQPIAHFPTPGDGSTQCLTNCQCHVEYRGEIGD